MTTFAATLADPIITFATTTWQVTDAEGVDWICELLEGWADTPDSTSPITPRSGDHGAWWGPGFYDARKLVLTGSILAPDPVLLANALEHLAADHYAALVGDAAILGVSEVDALKQLLVRPDKARLKVTYLTPSIVRVVIELIAGWPVKESPSQDAVTGGTTTGQGRTYPRPDAHGWWAYGPSGATGDIFFTNDGNAPTRPQFLITGPATNPSIYAADQGKRLGFAITLGASDQLFVDTDTKAVLLNDIGNRRYVLTPDSAWFYLQPGDNWIQYRSDSNTGTLRMRASDGWW